MRYDLATLIKRAGPRRRSHIVLRPIVPPATLAGDLYALGYKPVIDAWTRAVERIIAAYERSVPVNDGLVRDAIFDLDSILASIGDELSRLVLTITPSLQAWGARVEKYHSGRWRGNILTAAGVDIATLLLASGQPQTVGETIAWNVSLVKSVSDDTRSKIASATFAAYQARKPARELAAELREVVGGSRTRALNIASDQLKKIASGLDKERMSEAGIERFKYRSSHKLHARPWHAHRDGKVYDLVSGKEIDGPDEIKPGDGPGEPPWCGCRRQAWIDLS